MRKSNAHGVQEITGTITLAQEDRFRIQTEGGQSLLFALGAGAGADVEDLEALAGSGRTVRVRYRGEPDAGAVALKLLPV